MIRRSIYSLGIYFAAAVCLFGQAPTLPKVPAADSSRKAEAAEKTAAKAEAAARAAEAAKSAEKAGAAQKASEKAKVAQESASKADAAQKSSEKAEAAQKAAEKAEVAQKAAEKAEAAQKAASKAETAQKAAEKAELAQKAASKVETAQKAAEKAEVAQKAASKAETAQKAAEKAEVAQKAASKAETAQKAASKAESAQGAAEKAAEAAKSVDKVQSISRTTESVRKVADQTESAGRVADVAEKADAAAKAASKAEAAKKAVESAQRATGVVLLPVATSLKEVPTANAPAEVTKAVPGKAVSISVPEKANDPTPNASGVAKNSPVNPTGLGESEAAVVGKKPGLLERLFGGAEKKDSAPSEKAPAGSSTASKSGDEPQTSAKVAGDPKSGANPDDASGEGARTFKAANRDSEKKGGERELTPGGAAQKDSGKSGKDPTPAEIAQEAVQDRVSQELVSVGVSPVAAERLAGRISAGDQDAAETTNLISSAAAALQLADASQAKIDKVLTEIAERRLTDASSGGTTDNLVGAEVVEAVIGRRLDPKLARPGEIGRALLDAKAAIQLVGLDETTGEGKALVEEIFTKGLRGDKARDAIQKVVRPIVQEAEREQIGGGTPAAAPATSSTKAPAVEVPNQVEVGTGRGPAPVEPSVPEVPVSAPVAEAPAAQPRDVRSALDFSDIDPSTPTESVADSLVAGSPRPGSDQLPADRGNPPKDDGKKDSPPPADPADKDKKDDGDGDASADASPTPPPKEEEDKSEDETPAPAAEEAPKDGTPNPMDESGGNPLELAARSGGRLGGEQAKSQTRALDLILGGGGAGGPGNNPDSDGGSIILSPGEIAILSKTLSGRTVIKTVNGAVDPNPLEEGSVTITERDLKELHLKGNGGAKGPTDNAPAPVPQDPHSPIAGPVTGPVPAAPAANLAAPSIAVDPQISGKVKANVQSTR